MPWPNSTNLWRGIKMPTFSYQGRDASGAAVSGSQEASSAAQLARSLSERQITPVKITEEHNTASTRALELSDLPGFRRVNIEELILFSRQMHSLTRAGVPITQAIRGLAMSIRNPMLSTALNQVAEELEQGMSLSSCMHKHPGVFSSFYVSVIHVGENSGQLDEAFLRISQYLSLERETSKNLKAATRYPLFVIIAMCAAVMVINFVVLPAFKDIFDRLNAELPLLTQWLFAISDFMRRGWYLLLTGVIGLLIGWHYYKKSAQGALRWDRLKLKLPLVGGLFLRIALGRFSRMFALALKSGVPIEQAISIIANAVGNRYVAAQIDNMRTVIERGETLTQAAHSTGLFTPLVMQMIAVGEEAGQIDEMLEQTADFYDEEVAYDLKNLASAIEPLLIIALAGLVLMLALSVFLPLWELSGAIN